MVYYFWTRFENNPVFILSIKFHGLKVTHQHVSPITMNETVLKSAHLGVDGVNQTIPRIL